MKLEPLTLAFAEHTVAVADMYQWHIYANLLEGLPNDNMNQKILDSLFGRALQLTGDFNQHTIEPKVTPIEYDGDYPFGTPMRLAGVVCIMGLQYRGTSVPGIGMKSSLTLICFQDTIAPPFEPDLLAEIKQMNWFDYAQDLKWDDM